jgi:hypothetical protein
MVINLINDYLVDNFKLEAAHAVTRTCTRYNADPAKVTFAYYIEREITSILAVRDKQKTSKVIAEISQEDPKIQLLQWPRIWNLPRADIGPIGYLPVCVG